MLDVAKHEYYLKRILREIVSQPKLGGQLVFKGGTCLYLFYGLDRFSVDLDFSLVPGGELAEEEMERILSRYLALDVGRFRQGEFGWLWQGSYKRGLRQMQVDVSKRQFPDTYEIKQFYGLSVRTLDQASLLAHKLCALLDRMQFQNRDLFDAHFMFERMFEVNQEIVKVRTGKGLGEYLRDLETYVMNEVDRGKILQGLGELVNESKKAWVKSHLVDELLAQLRMKVEELEKGERE